ncbi:MAG: hypothetical protein ACE37H_02705 [Phycisphaeraceae bacterium]
MHRYSIDWLPGGKSYNSLFDSIQVTEGVLDAISDISRNHLIYAKQGYFQGGLRTAPDSFKQVIKCYIDDRTSGQPIEHLGCIRDMLDCMITTIGDWKDIDSRARVCRELFDIVLTLHNYALYERCVNCRAEFTFLCLLAENDAWFWREKGQYEKAHHGLYAIIDIIENIDEAKWAESLVGAGPDMVGGRKLFWHGYGERQDDEPGLDLSKLSPWVSYANPLVLDQATIDRVHSMMAKIASVCGTRKRT